MFSMLASSNLRSSPVVNLLSNRVGREQIRHAVKKAGGAGGNRQVLGQFSLSFAMNYVPLI